MQFQFYKHPFIDLIIKDPWIKKHELFERSGIKEKQIFNKEFNKLKTDGHIQEESGQYRPSALSLMVSIKETGSFVDRIPIKYMPENELEQMFGFIQSGDEPEDYFGFKLFIEYIPLNEAFKSFFEESNDIKLDMGYYNYYLFAEYIDLTTQNRQTDRPKNITIVMLDSNHVFAEELGKNLKEKYLQDVTWLHFAHPDDAIRLLQDKFEENDPVNLVITNMELIALDGYQFAKIVRILEDDNHSFPVPVFAISEGENTDTLINKGLEEKVFNHCFHRSNNIQADIRNICNYVKAAFWSNIFAY